MNKKNLFKLVLVGLGNNASKTLKRLNKDAKIQVVYCIPRISLSNNGWFDKGILADTSKKLGINIIKKKNLNDPNFVKLIASSNIDLIINIGHAQLFNLDLINSSTFGILNYHPGLLPGARGSGAVVGSSRRLTDTDQLIASSVMDVKKATDHLSLQRAFLGAQLNKAELQKDAIDQRIIATSERISDLGEADMAAIVTQIQSLLVNRDAAQQAYAKISQNSLFDFLK